MITLVVVVELISVLGLLIHLSITSKKGNSSKIRK